MSGDTLLVRFGEIGLKGGNRHEFLARLARNVRHALKRFPSCDVEPLQGRLLVRTSAPAPPPLVEALARVCGVTSVSRAIRVERDFAAIESAALAAVESTLAHSSPHAAPHRSPNSAPRTFRVTTNRADKRFPTPSMELDRRLGAAILAKFPSLRVDLERPELELGVEVREEGVFLYHERTAGPGGLPVGSLGRALALLSGGIDSPVATYLAMKRGLEVQAVFFHAAEFTGHGAIEKTKRIAQVLSGFEPRFALHVVPFAPVQVAVKERCDAAYRTLLYRRSMHRIAVELARRERLAALVSGDVLGQVASQTLENLALTAAASELPLLRPLLTYDKEETVALARRIGTYELSILPEPDCCTLFQPPHPRIRGDPADVAANEERLDLPALVAAALAGVETWIFHDGAGGHSTKLAREDAAPSSAARAAP